MRTTTTEPCALTPGRYHLWRCASPSLASGCATPPEHPRPHLRGCSFETAYKMGNLPI